MSAPYPFSALVGAEDLRLALILNAVSPAIGGVLVRGEKGTAKSTAVRGLAALLPEVEVVAGCTFSCDPHAPDPRCPDGPHAGGDAESRPARLVELPVGASEDRVTGSLDLERALTEGLRAFQPGLLADAHRGVLYVDEVNLLGDHLVDVLLDAAAMGFNIVEREGVSVRHASRFQLVGTMNPEEGELRPQLLDRFGLTVGVRASRDRAERTEVVRRRLDYEADSEEFARRWADADAETAGRIAAARKLVSEVVLGERALEAVVAACSAFEVDGMRADIVTAKTACALAAWEGRGEVSLADVRAAALLALPHRRRRGPFESPGIDEEALDEALRDFDEGPDDDGPDGGGPGGGRDGGGPDGGGPDDGGGRDDGDPGEDISDEGGSAAGQAARPAGTDGPRDAQDGEVACDPAHGRAQMHATPDDDPRDGASKSAAGGREPITLPVGAMFDPVLLQTGGSGAGALGRRSPGEGERGRHAGDRLPRGPLRDLAVGATLRAAAPQQRARR
ncbi:MAG TPA: ATP-binding protein, partial [Egibacteraceae bacterium]|nr:ATP-binding protein [Egibacteraceae bacterium]